MIVSRLARLAAATLVAVAGLTVVAAAAPTVKTATTNATANLRQGPGTSFATVDTLDPGTDVIVQACTDAWCAVSTDADNGFIYKPLLDFDGPNEFPPPPSPKPPKPPKPKPQVDAGVCFFQGTGYTGPSFCAQSGEGGRVPFPFRGRIRSILIDGGVEVEVCAGPNGNGECKTLDRSLNALSFNANIGSYQVGGDDGGHYSGPNDNNDDEDSGPGDDDDDDGDDSPSITLH